MNNVLCPFCNSTTYDNRNNKRTPKAPDFKCSNKNSCGAGGWLNKDQSAVNFTHNGAKAYVTMGVQSKQNTAQQSVPKINTYTNTPQVNRNSSVQEGIYTAWAKDLAIAMATKKSTITKEELFDLVTFFFSKLTGLLSGGASIPEIKNTIVDTPTIDTNAKQNVQPQDEQSEAIVDSSEINLEDFNFDDLGV
jgi:hypothetical protein